VGQAKKCSTVSFQMKWDVCLCGGCEVSCKYKYKYNDWLDLLCIAVMGRAGSRESGWMMDDAVLFDVCGAELRRMMDRIHSLTADCGAPFRDRENRRNK
jgi:hypothetical protein